MSSSNAAILVVGDSILDFHLFGSSTRLSPEGPVPIVHVNKEECTLGAAGNVAANITSVGITCYFAFKHPSLKYIKNTENAHEILEIMHKENNIRSIPLYMNKKQSITIKRRIWSNGQQICRIDKEDISPPKENLEIEWFEKIKNIIDSKNIKIVIISDYNKGTLTDKLIMRIADHCKEKDISTVLDPKRPTFYKLGELTIVKPNSRELSSTNLSQIQCSKRLKNTYLINTLGKEGMVAFQNGREIYSCPTIAQDVYDVTGAGDSASALLGICLYYNMNIFEAINAANKAASYTLKHLGCYVLSKQEIKNCIEYGKSYKAE